MKPQQIPRRGTNLLKKTLAISLSLEWFCQIRSDSCGWLWNQAWQLAFKSIDITHLINQLVLAAVAGLCWTFLPVSDIGCVTSLVALIESILSICILLPTVLSLPKHGCLLHKRHILGDGRKSICVVNAALFRSMSSLFGGSAVSTLSQRLPLYNLPVLLSQMSWSIQYGTWPYHSSIMLRIDSKHLGLLPITAKVALNWSRRCSMERGQPFQMLSLNNR